MTTDKIRLERLQNRIARLVTGAELRTSSDERWRDLKWDLIKKRRKKHMFSFIQKTEIRLSLPSEYIAYVIPESKQWGTCWILRNSRWQSLPYSRTTPFRQAFILSTTRLWNSLPDILHVNISMTAFKRKITNYFKVTTPPVYYGLGTQKGNRLHTRLRLGMACLNAHQD